MGKCRVYHKTETVDSYTKTLKIQDIREEGKKGRKEEGKKGRKEEGNTHHIHKVTHHIHKGTPCTK